MQDAEIVELYWNRDESAITETQNKYERYLTKIAYNVLSPFIGRFHLGVCGSDFRLHRHQEPL